MRTEKEIKDELNKCYEWKKKFSKGGMELEESIRIGAEIEMLEWVLEESK